MGEQSGKTQSCFQAYVSEPRKRRSKSKQEAGDAKGNSLENGRKQSERRNKSQERKETKNGWCRACTDVPFIKISEIRSRPKGRQKKTDKRKTEKDEHRKSLYKAQGLFFKYPNNQASPKNRILILSPRSAADQEATASCCAAFVQQERREKK